SEGSHTVFVHGKDANNTWESSFSSATFTKDTVAPFVSSISLADADPTNATSVRFTVTFDGSVTGVDSSDFTPTTTGGISGATVTGVSGGSTIYTVTVSTGSGNGTLHLDLKSSGTGIADTAGNPIGG